MFHAPVEDMVLCLGSLATSPLSIRRLIVFGTRPEAPYHGSFSLFDERTGGTLRELRQGVSATLDIVRRDPHVLQNLETGGLPGQVEVDDHIDPCRIVVTVGARLDKAPIFSTA